MNHLYEFAAPAISAGTAVALLCVLVSIVLGRFYKYWVVIIYTSWELIATAGLTIAYTLYHQTFQAANGSRTAVGVLYGRLYWINDVLVDLLRFVLVIVLIYRASEGTRKLSGRLLSAVTIITILLPFILFKPEFRDVEIFSSFHVPLPRGGWFESTSELLNFGAAIMNSMLWAILLASKRRDPQLVLVSLGLGIVVTGTAFSYGARHLLAQHDIGLMGYLVMNLTQLIGWLIWCRAFWPSRPRRILPAAVPTP